ncbi:hypothetical protein AAG570_009848 [Ranatra chinensis]|uniref:Uncharacterized protein n=1 Tax=Ranatra chinensis TaxID=642074 RepID=A0ABD0YQU9_9HEMI
MGVSILSAKKTISLSPVSSCDDTSENCQELVIEGNSDTCLNFSMDNNENGCLEVSVYCKDVLGGQSPLTDVNPADENETEKNEDGSKSEGEVGGSSLSSEIMTEREAIEDLSNLASGVTVVEEGHEDQAVYVNQICFSLTGYSGSWLQAEVHIIQRESVCAWAHLAWSVEAPSPEDWIGLYFLLNSACLHVADDEGERRHRKSSLVIQETRDTWTRTRPRTISPPPPPPSPRIGTTRSGRSWTGKVGREARRDADKEGGWKPPLDLVSGRSQREEEEGSALLRLPDITS